MNLYTLTISVGISLVFLAVYWALRTRSQLPETLASRAAITNIDRWMEEYLGPYWVQILTVFIVLLLAVLIVK